MKPTIKKLTAHIAAVVTGVDLRLPVDAETAQLLREALYEHAVLLFRDQDITDDQHVAFSEIFGPVEMTSPTDPIGDGGPVGVISNLDEYGEIIPSKDPRVLYLVGNSLWHSDGSFREVPLRASLLVAKVVPPKGGNTEFASLQAPYEGLSAARQTSLEGLVAEHSLAHSRDQIAPNLVSDEWRKEIPPTPQLMVRTIPETGKNVLFVGSYTTHIVGWPLQKGRTLLKELYEWCTEPQFVYSHVWRPNDLLAYDNRLCLHRVRPWDMDRHKRILHRTTIAGDGPTVP
jgi:alpha-ketoglutarate-dependent 2,4-dichlorophenoxyacetate dioxygenase